MNLGPLTMGKKIYFVLLGLACLVPLASIVRMTMAGLGSAGASTAGIGIFIIVIWLGGFAIYFLPTELAWKKGNFNAIFALNALAGWSVIGWIIALVWALSHDASQTVAVASTPAGGPAILCSACGKYSPYRTAFCSFCGAGLNSP